MHRDLTPTPASTPHPSRVKPLLLVGASVLLLGGGTWWKWQSSLTPSRLPLTQNAVPGTVSSAAEQTVQVYWLKTVDGQLKLGASPVTLPSGQPEALLKRAIAQLLQQPTDPTLASTVPQATQLLDLAIKPDGIHLNLSRQFTSGGGSASMAGRLGQIIYTATTLDPNADVWIAVEGKPLTVLGGEGLLLDQPTNRARFNKDFTAYSPN